MEGIRAGGGVVEVGTDGWVEDCLSPAEEVRRTAARRVPALWAVRSVAGLAALVGLVTAGGAEGLGTAVAGLALLGTAAWVLVVGRGWTARWRTAAEVAAGTVPATALAAAPRRQRRQLATLPVVGLSTVGVVVAGVVIAGHDDGTGAVLVLSAIALAVAGTAAVGLALAPRPATPVRPPVGSRGWSRPMTADRREAEAARLRAVARGCAVAAVVDAAMALFAVQVALGERADVATALGWVGVAFLWAPPTLAGTGAGVLAGLLPRIADRLDSGELSGLQWLVGPADVALAGRYLTVVAALGVLVLVAVAVVADDVPLHALLVAAWTPASVGLLTLTRPALRRPEAIRRA
ncbi:hypothetical protein [Euzebya sp.]|uniref:hypothetical protein n=1 Tax=Euzebya sp. TaxID=1971409 RepID=UPI003515D25F